MKKLIVITGGTSGLGKTLATLLSPEYSVFVIARKQEAINKICQEIDCDGCVADVSDYARISSAFARIIGKYNHVFGLVNCAGIWLKGQIEDNDPEEITKVININTLGTIFACKAVIPYFKQQKQGTIINVISQDALYAKADRSVYHASKWALNGFTQCLQHDLNPYKIRVSGVFPALMNTELFEKFGNHDRDMSQAMEPIEVAKSIKYILDQKDDIVIPMINIRSIDYLG